MNQNRYNNYSDQTSNCQHIIISHLEIPLREVKELSHYSLDHRLQPWIARHCGINEADVLDYTITHRSLDARRKPNIRFVYQLSVTLNENSPVREDASIVVHTPAPNQNHHLYQLPTLPFLPQFPIIVGTGPAGMMAAYLFALYGCRPLIIERGFEVAQRRADIESFLHTRQLNPESNYLFGEGGAGTYSDGKLYTRIKDHRIHFLLEAYVAARAPRRILYDHHPHIGSDILPYMVRRLRKQIEQWGGSFRWGIKVENILIRNDRCCGVILENGETLEGPLTLIASGHSARDLIRKLVQQGIKHRAKDFQLGCRIEHPQSLIDQAQYGWTPPRHLVGAAEYNLTSRPSWKRRHPACNRVTTFCVCPGGEIVAATSDEGQFCTNGMSRFLRNGFYANAGLIVNQDITRFHSALDALDVINEIERRAFSAGGNNYSCPAQSAISFVRGEQGLHTTETSYRLGITSGRLDQLLPRSTVKALCEALKYFEKLTPGFMQSGVLLGVETRVSSPVRFERHPETLSSSLPGLYLAGEGAGYAGGITSSALDGLRIVETILTGKPATRKE
jgi:uncharacterized FAD-dependent dehydrogenase